MSRLAAGVAVLSFLALAAALVSQHLFDMQPCAWCVLQRIALVVVGGLGAGAAFAGRRSTRATRVIAGGGGIAASAGAVAAWYQYTVAANLESCDRTLADVLVAGSGLDYLLPWLFGVYASCADARVHLLGIEYAVWGLLIFVAVGAALFAVSLSPLKTVDK